MNGYLKGIFYFFATIIICAIIFILASIIVAKLHNSTLLGTLHQWFNGGH